MIHVGIDFHSRNMTLADLLRADLIPTAHQPPLGQREILGSPLAVK